VQLQQEVGDTHKWRFDTSGQHSAKSAYGNLFLGATLFNLMKEHGRHGRHRNASCSYG
jgi:hypothetical protein